MPARKLKRSLNLSACLGPNLIGRREEALASHGMALKSLRVGKGEDGRSLEVQALIETPKNARLEVVSAQIASWENVFELDIQ